MASAKKGCVIVGIVGVVLILCCGGGLGTFALVLFQFTSGAVNAGDEFLTKLGNGQTSEAYQSAAQVLRNGQSEADFASVVKQLGLDRYKSSLWLNRSVNNDTAELKGTVYLTDGESQSMTVQLVKEDDAWKVVSFIGSGVATSTSPTDLNVVPYDASVSNEPPAAPPAAPVDPSAPPAPADAPMEESVFAPGPLPNDDEARAIATLALLEFGAGLSSGDFTAFCEQASTRLRETNTPTDIANSFSALRYQQVDFDDLTADELEFSEAPALNDKNVLQMTGSFYRGLVRVDFGLAHVYETDDWKLFGIEVKAIPVEEAIPEEPELQMLVTQSLLDFSDAIQSKDYTAFHASLSQAFQQQMTAADLATTFQPFTLIGLDLSTLRDQPPEITAAPVINEDGVLVIEGKVPVSGLSFKFDLKYLLEGDEWKLFGINGSL